MVMSVVLLCCHDGVSSVFVICCLIVLIFLLVVFCHMSVVLLCSQQCQCCQCASVMVSVLFLDFSGDVVLSL